MWVNGRGKGLRAGNAGFYKIDGKEAAGGGGGTFPGDCRMVLDNTPHSLPELTSDSEEFQVCI